MVTRCRLLHTHSQALYMIKSQVTECGIRGTRPSLPLFTPTIYPQTRYNDITRRFFSFFVFCPSKKWEPGDNDFRVVVDEASEPLWNHCRTCARTAEQKRKNTRTRYCANSEICRDINNTRDMNREDTTSVEYMVWDVGALGSRAYSNLFVLWKNYSKRIVLRNLLMRSVYYTLQWRCAVTNDTSNLLWIRAWRCAHFMFYESDREDHADSERVVPQTRTCCKVRCWRTLIFQLWQDDLITSPQQLVKCVKAICRDSMSH